VPEGLRPAIQTLIELDQRKTDSLMEALKAVTPTLDTEDLAAQLAEQLKGVLDGQTVEMLTGGLVAIASGPGASEMSPKDFAEGIAESPDLVVPAKERGRARDRVLSFMGITPLVITARALDVLNEQPARFLSARVLTDLRPVFGADIDASPAGAIIVHNLRISYSVARRQEQFFVALDSEDLDTLEGVITRARRKAKSMSSILRSAHVPDVSPRGKESSSA
jgi:hypothetical protein